jgi:ABC-type transport system involved in cytochrome bd biosynthesis fused ATPase/permease subunit
MSLKKLTPMKYNLTLIPVSIFILLFLLKIKDYRISVIMVIALFLFVNIYNYKRFKKLQPDKKRLAGLLVITNLH